MEEGAVDRRAGAVALLGEDNDLLKAWEHKFHIEAMHKAREIFPNLNGCDAEDDVEGSMEDPDAFWQVRDLWKVARFQEDEWEDWVGNEAL